MQNGLRMFQRRDRDDRLNGSLFFGLAYARAKLNARGDDKNHRCQICLRLRHARILSGRSCDRLRNPDQLAVHILGNRVNRAARIALKSE